MSALHKPKQVIVQVVQFLAWPVAWSLGTFLYRPFVGIALLGCFGLYHLVLAVRVGAISRENYHWWNILAAALGSGAAYLLIHRLLHLHDLHGHWGWLLLVLYVAVLVKGGTLEEKQKTNRKLAMQYPGDGI